MNDANELRRLLAQTTGVPELRPPQPPTLIEFLRARIGDDEALALNAFRDYGDGEPKNGPDWFEPWSGTVECGRGGEHIQTFDSGLSRHIVNHDPARVIREVQAKRAILHEHLEVECCATCLDDVDGCPTFRAMAYAYAGHPDHQEHWKP